jgi:hypothetical protein
MSVKSVTYWLVECDEPGCGVATGDLGEYGAWAERSVAIEDWGEGDGAVGDGGEAFCHKHRVGKTCNCCSRVRETRDSGDGDRICDECKAALW